MENLHVSHRNKGDIKIIKDLNNGTCLQAAPWQPAALAKLKLYLSAIKSADGRETVLESTAYFPSNQLERIRLHLKTIF